MLFEVYFRVEFCPHFVVYNGAMGSPTDKSRRDEVLRRMLQTPPDPRVTTKKPKREARHHKKGRRAS